MLCAALGGAAAFAGGCQPGDMAMDPDNMPPDPPKGNASFLVQESVEQLQVTHAKSGLALAVFDKDGKKIQSGVADKQGSLVFRLVPPGSGYTVRTTAVQPEEYTRPLTVMSVPGSKPSPDFYKKQKLVAGSGYIKMRDGTQLAIYVTLPGPIDKGPYPTLVNYSGYSPAKPGKPMDGLEGLCRDFPILCDAPDDPSALIAGLMGFATVGVNMRGTGCSGGAYDFFDTLQQLDSYDIIEAVAAQDWVMHHKVGMSGISYPGYSQLFAAAQQPPSLAAITPLSVLGNTFQTLAPGGILNTGFAVTWAQRVLDKADPYGQGWEKDRVAAGDKLCEENQLLHSQKVDIIKLIGENPYYRADLGDPINPDTFVDKIKVPTFVAGAWQDEQTGPYFTSLFTRLTGAPVKRFTAYNGVHPDAFAPQVLAEWKNFLDLYLAKRVPFLEPKLRALAPLLFKNVFGASIPIPDGRFDMITDYQTALAKYEAEPELRIIFESGASTKADTGAPAGTFEQTFAKWPPPATTPLRLYFGVKGTDGTLSPTAPTEMNSASAWKHDPDQGQRTNLAPGGDIWALLPKYDYKPLREGYALAFLSEPLVEDTVMIGTASADLYIRSTANDADLQVSLTEVRADGQEVYVQSGWLRASQRKLAKTASELLPEHTHLREDVQPLATDAWTPVRVVVPGFGHPFRKGSRVRISVDTPGATRAAWKFQTLTLPAGTTHKLAHAMMQPSSIVLPVVKGVAIPTPAPACPSLRGQPCRAYKALVNSPGT